MTWIRWMLDLLKRWKLRHRAVFRYWDGVKMRYGDPFDISRKLQHDEKCDFERTAPGFDASEEPDTTNMLDLFVRVFNLTRWNGSTGLMGREIIGVFNQYSDYLEGVKKNVASGPTSSPPTEPESS